MSTPLLEDVDISTITSHSEPGDHDRFSHYVDKGDIVESAMTGKPVYALCGKKWTPNASPEKFPVCPECKDQYENVVQKG